MDLNLDALANSIIEEYKKRTDDAKLVENFIASAGTKSTYSDVYKMAKKAGLNLEQAIINQWTFDANETYLSTLKELLKKTTGPMHDDIAEACKYIQDNMNKAAGINLKSQLAPVNEYDLGDIAARMKNKGITQISGELQTLGCKMVDDNENANMDLLTDSGYEIIVTRKYDSIGLRKNTRYAERCAFCTGLVGTHTFKSAREARESGIFKRHAGCGCVIDYQSKRSGTVTRNVQNYNTGKVTKQKNLSRKTEVQNNLSKLENLGPKNVNTDALDFMSNSFKPEYSEKTKVTTLNGSTTELALKKVSNSHFDIWAQEEVSERNMAVKYVEKHLAEVQENLDLVDIPTVRIIDFEKYLGSNAIASYDKADKILYWNNAFKNEKRVSEYLKKYPGLFASTDVNAPFLHELGHRFYEESINSIAKTSNLSYYDAKNKVDFNILSLLQTKENTAEWLEENLSYYASRNYSNNKITEVVAEAFSSQGEKEISKEIIDAIKEVK